MISYPNMYNDVNYSGIYMSLPYQQLGLLKKSSADLDAAILQEPQLIDAYWHRHLLHLLQNKRQAALDDLNVILKHNKHHASAYRSRYVAHIGHAT